MSEHTPLTEAERIEQAIYDVAVDHPMWIGDDNLPLDYSPVREARIGDFVRKAARAALAAHTPTATAHEACDDPRCQITEHRAHQTAGWLTETERLILRNTLLANEDMGLTAAEATAVAYIVKPAVERILAARTSTATAEPCEACGDCTALVIGPNTDGDPCHWCQTCGCHYLAHAASTATADTEGAGDE